MPFKFLPLETPGLMLIKPRVFSDDREFFQSRNRRSSCARQLLEVDKRDTERAPLSEEPQGGKIVSCVKGRIYDVTADIRKRSPYYKKWLDVELTEENKYLLYVPPGYAHGIQVISDTAEVMYKCAE